MTYLNDLEKQYNVFIYRNVRKYILSLYENEEDKTIVESALSKIVDDLAIFSFNIDLNSKVSEAAH